MPLLDARQPGTDLSRLNARQYTKFAIKGFRRKGLCKRSKRVPLELTSDSEKYFGFVVDHFFLACAYNKIAMSTTLRTFVVWPASQNLTEFGI